MINKLSTFIKVGVVEGLNVSSKRSIVVSNIVFFNIAVCCFLVVLMCMKQELIALVYGGISFVSLICVLLNLFHFYTFSRVFFLLILNAGVFFAASLSLSDISYADDRLFILTNILLVGVLFNVKEKLLIGVFFLFTIILLIAFDPLRDQIQSFLSIEPYSPTSPVAYIFKFALAGITVFLCIFYFQAVVNYSDKKNQKSIKDKELLIKEIHHRVKNNLQVISSLLNLQSNYLDDESYKNVFQNTQNRIKTIAIVHEKLYQSNDLKHINLVQYLTSIVGLISSSFDRDSIQINYSMEENLLEKFSIEKAIPCGLIVNEIITNAYKHAFVNRDNGEININFIKLDEEYQMTIEDNGVGFRNDFEFKKLNSLGYELIDSLVAQLEGSFVFESIKGARIVIKFP